MFEHETVLQKEAVNGLNIKPDGIYVDCTVGGGGHSINIVKQLDENGLLIAFDQDQNALETSRKRLKAYEKNILFIHKNFRYLERELHERHISSVDGVLFDLGVSSPQFDQAERGFSYRFDAKLDMRMNQEQELSAYDIVNTWPYEKLVHIFYDYGEERFSKQVAREIERRRSIKPIETTFQLVEIIKEAIPAPARRKGGHPAKRIFQALRIAVNDELKAFRDALHQAARIVGIKGRIAVITFHSLEDRLCKQAFRKWSRPKETPRHLPVLPEGFEAPFTLITRKPITPTEDEVKRNKRARSAILRIVEKKHPWSDDFIYEEGWRK